MTSVAVVGLGAMGSRIAERLVESGHEVAVWNRTEAKVARLVERGATAHATPSDAARAADVVMSMLADPEALASVSEGDDGILAGLRYGATLVEMSTVGPSAIERLASQIPAGRSIVDAPVLGSIGEVEAGKLKIFVGGDETDYERLHPLHSELGEPLHAGPVGSGAAAKLVANLTLVATLGTLGESVALAQGLGLARNVTFDVLAATPIGTQATRRREAIETRAFPKHFALSLARKDAELVAGAAADASVRVPVAEAAGSWFATAEREGWGELDYSAVLAWILGEAKPSA